MKHRKQVSVRLEESMHRALRLHCLSNGITINQALEGLIMLMVKDGERIRSIGGKAS